MISEAYLIGMPDTDAEASVAYKVLAEQVKERIITRSASPLNKIWRKQAGQFIGAPDPRLRWGEIS